MLFSPRLGVALMAGLFLAIPAAAQNPIRVQRVSASQSGDEVEIRIQLSVPVVPESQAITGPDRIAVDFPGALPAASLHAIGGDFGALKSVRTGLFANHPPVTRVVLDLTAPQTYGVFMDQNVVIVKIKPLTSSAQSGGATLQNVAQIVASAAAAKPVVDVIFQGGMLRIRAQKATLAEVLFEVQRQTGAEIAIPAGAEQEVVAIDLGPAPPRDVLSALLNGSRYNFIFVGNDGNLQKAILSVR